MMEYNSQTKNRLKRIEGQLKGVLRMMEQEKNCQDVVTQLSAVRSAVERTIGLVVSKNLEFCIREQIENDQDTGATVDEAIKLLVKSR